MVRLLVKDNEDETEIIEVENWDPAAFDDEMKTSDSPGVFIGSSYYWKIDVRRIKVLEEEEVIE